MVAVTVEEDFLKKNVTYNMSDSSLFHALGLCLRLAPDRKLQDQQVDALLLSGSCNSNMDVIPKPQRRLS